MIAQNTTTRAARFPRIEPPGPDEYAPFYAGYVANVVAADLTTLLVGQPGELRKACSELDEEGALRRYAPGKWSVKQLLGHLTDAERVFAYRLLRVSRGDATPLAGFDEAAYVDAADFDARPLADLLEDLAAARESTLSLIGGIPTAGWDHRGVANGSPISARALPHIIAGHFEHHRHILRERYGIGHD